MIDQQTKHRFVELRAEGWTIARLAETLQVSKRTLVDWNRTFRCEIEDLRLVDLEARQQQLLAEQEQELTRLAAHRTAIEQELATRDLKNIPTEKLFRLAALLRGQIHELQARRLSYTQGPPELSPSSETPGAPLPRIHSDCSSRGDEAVATEPPASPPNANEPPSHPETSDVDPIANQKSKIENFEHCLHRGDPLPPLQSDGTRPSPWCGSCKSPIGANPGLSIRELCPYCHAVIPVHGYNIKRHSNTCRECRSQLPNLEVNAPLKWLPPNSELQHLVQAVAAPPNNDQQSPPGNLTVTHGNPR